MALAEKNMPLQSGAVSEAESFQRLKDDLELIAYTTSHDLSAPLRIIRYATETLREQRGDKANPHEQEALETINEETTRLKAMLQAVQDYIRLETFPVKPSVLDANELVAEACERLSEEIYTAGAMINYGVLPQVIGHKGRLTRLFSILLDNAIKFRSELPPQIQVTAEHKEGVWVFCVADNGIGIDEEYQEIIFQLFQRLNVADRYPGLGIGLALAQKIILSHGGRLWAESTAGKGSRFFFTLAPAEN